MVPKVFLFQQFDARVLIYFADLKNFKCITLNSHLLISISLQKLKIFLNNILCVYFCFLNKILITGSLCTVQQQQKNEMTTVIFQQPLAGLDWYLVFKKHQSIFLYLLKGILFFQKNIFLFLGKKHSFLHNIVCWQGLFIYNFEYQAKV